MSAPTRAWLARLALGAASLALAGCGGGGGGGGSSTPPTTTTQTPPAPIVQLAANQLAVTVEQEPDITTYITADTPYATVTVCDALGNCSTVDHVLVDTGSYGLRLFASALSSNVQLTPMLSTSTGTSGQPIGECASFISSSVWGAVRIATIQLGAMTASNVPIQIMADPTFPDKSTALPGSTNGVCPNASAKSSEQQFGAKGVLGVGMFKNDIQSYYACTTSSCTSVKPPHQVSNPVASLPTDNNGVILTLPAVSANQTTLSGVLTFGVDTQSNNQLDGYTVLQATTSGDLTATMNGASYPASFIDSGSNAYFVDLPGVTPGSDGFYDPPQLTTYPVTLSVGSVSYTSNVSVQASGSQLGIAVYPYLAAPSKSKQAQDFGLPFFYGKSIAYVIESAVTSHGTGPFYAIK